jgi:hypothetical protein
MWPRGINLTVREKFSSSLSYLQVAVFRLQKKEAAK